jgi:hypothetical protein
MIRPNLAKLHLLLEETGKSFTHHVLERRLDKAAALLRDPRWRDRKIADIAAEAGFTDLSHFNRAFRRQYGATPSDLRAAVSEDKARQDTSEPSTFLVGKDQSVQRLEPVCPTHLQADMNSLTHHPDCLLGGRFILSSTRPTLPDITIPPAQRGEVQYR